MTEHMQEVNYDPSVAAHGKAAEPSANPPSYDYATGGQAPRNDKVETRKPSAMPKPGPSAPYSPPPAPPSGNNNLHYYQHPITGHTISTVLPPDHPEMICLQAGEHVRNTKFGILGILAAVFWFPLGIGLCLLDRRIVCKRCGRVIDGGISC